ncbi:MAG: type I restriction enzyme HsdR N-terminal domain-containing protein [Tidjanibacter sp.]|nr:type I restriction enzyme HsdR N-terminal domain-containing protein [Tidjanibacter sp.]
MDFKDQIKKLSERIDVLKGNLPTEEATKNALIMPFISALGYDVFNPLEVLPEMHCDIGTKKGEKIDYAILRDGEPIILVECKHWEQNLCLHDNQLLRYFHVSKAKFGILTNGIIYKFYTDLETPNKMDEKPFLEVNMLDLKDEQIEELKKFHLSYFDVSQILSSASELKYMGELKKAIGREFANPSADFVKYFGKQVYEGVFNQKVLDQFSVLVRRTISNYINEMISDRLKAAIKESNVVAVPESKPEEEAVIEVEEKPSRNVVTTVEEMEAFYIVKAILRGVVPVERITYRDAQSYFAIFLDDNNRRLVCRFYLSTDCKRIAFVDENKKESRIEIAKLDDIYQYSNEIIAAASKFI